MEQQLAAGAHELLIAEFVQDQGIEPRQVLGELVGLIPTGFELEPVHQVGGVVAAVSMRSADT